MAGTHPSRHARARLRGPVAATRSTWPTTRRGPRSGSRCRSSSCTSSSGIRRWAAATTTAGRWGSSRRPRSPSGSCRRRPHAAGGARAGAPFPARPARPCAHRRHRAAQPAAAPRRAGGRRSWSSNRGWSCSCSGGAASRPRPRGGTSAATWSAWCARSTQPILAVGEAFREPERVLVAFDGSSVTRRGIELIARSALFRAAVARPRDERRRRAGMVTSSWSAPVPASRRPASSAEALVRPGDPEREIARAMQRARERPAGDGGVRTLGVPPAVHGEPHGRPAACVHGADAAAAVMAFAGAGRFQRGVSAVRAAVQRLK